MKKPMITILCCAVFLVFAVTSARTEMDIAGVWKAVDAMTGRVLSHVRIWEKDGVYYGKVEYVPDPSSGERCVDCAAPKKERPVAGMVMLWGMKKSADRDEGYDRYDGGRILDLKSGNNYRCTIWQVSDDKLRVRRYVLFFYPDPVLVPGSGSAPQFFMEDRLSRRGRPRHTRTASRYRSPSVQKPRARPAHGCRCRSTAR